jgi:pimeloyl-ACP methyl ester carboxylesterase
MKNIAFFSFLLLSSFMQAQHNDIYSQLIGQTDSCFYYIKNGKAANVYERFSDDMKRQLSVSQMEDTWATMEMQVGELLQENPTSIDELNGNFIATKLLKFEKYSLNFRVTYDSASTIVGLFFLPATQGYKTPDYVTSLNFTEYKITFGKEPYLIEGTLSLPRTDSKVPLAIIVHGSGPMDRDGTLSPNKMYKDIAWGLASKGIATFRYDKRTYIYGMMMLGNKDSEKMTIEEEVVQDVLLAIEALSTQTGIDQKQIWIVGHSQGGMVAPMLASKSKKIKGIVMLAANARPLQDLLIEQVDYLQRISEDQSEASKQKTEQIIRQANYAKQENLPLTTPTDSLPFGSNAAYWNYLNQYNQVKTAKKLKKTKIYIMQGQRDYQVTTEDYNIWRRELGEKADGILYEKLNHLFMEGKGQPNPAEYMKQNNVAIQVIDQLVHWIKTP